MTMNEALQFEGMFNKNDVIGQWRKAKPNEAPGESRDPGRQPDLARRSPWDMLSLQASARSSSVWTSKTGQPVVHDVDYLRARRRVPLEDQRQGWSGRTAGERSAWPDQAVVQQGVARDRRGGRHSPEVWTLDTRAYRHLGSERRRCERQRVRGPAGRQFRCGGEARLQAQRAAGISRLASRSGRPIVARDPNPRTSAWSSANMSIHLRENPGRDHRRRPDLRRTILAPRRQYM